MTYIKQERLANNLRALRKQRKLRQVDIADILGFEVSDRISYWERGQAKPGLENILKLCILFNTDISEIYPELFMQAYEKIHASKNTRYLRSKGEIL